MGNEFSASSTSIKKCDLFSRCKIILRAHSPDVTGKCVSKRKNECVLQTGHVLCVHQSMASSCQHRHSKWRLQARTNRMPTTATGVAARLNQGLTRPQGLTRSPSTECTRKPYPFHIADKHPVLAPLRIQNNGVAEETITTHRIGESDDVHADANSTK